MNRPTVIFLDAVGTLFDVQGSVGKIYSPLARQFGVDVHPSVLDRAFIQSFRAAPPMAFPGVDPIDVPGSEFAWWRSLALQTFEHAGVLDQFSNFSEFFSALYAHFATAEPWFVYADVRAAIEHWLADGIQLGVVSNFDSRLYAVLQTLDLTDYFTSVTISTEVGAAKPDAHIFLTALKKHQCTPEAAWHIGDSYTADYEGAKAAGLRGIWIDRSHRS